MAGVNLADNTLEVIEAMSYDHHTSRKNIVEKMFGFAMAHEDAFLKEMFENGEPAETPPE